ncbi:dihydrofolate reductase family protein [Ligilactobacillus murinus]|uniref:dihydrofolate reductase family protein n=1 Tax=Ligilactobacillus murinus TaxID=1622 RepID=UPI0003A13606|nr:dihydrofolate reductase family protein [Ligilactobacillus murinus]MCR1880393.1 dihydrofolate reductase family protein [Ligilactobacillus murinus]MCZ0673746.1 dihydrofolate reductase family protein [Ligilactobacillus murinus]MCZ0694665.1 dihydrofolate reductase family protein [Ligilactobacillus murinus]MCZ0700729.1 dihydrofolate reductase family protein [Ligilactobacillus murinus]MCZ0705939.1 dihydrofolate reductase family protein [Ligilactobacillus murinus]
MQSDLIDEYYLSIMPIVLGDGIMLFDQIAPSQKLKLLQTKTYNGIGDLHYVKC